MARGALANAVERAARATSHLTARNGAGGQVAASVYAALVTIMQAATEAEPALRLAPARRGIRLTCG
jgi:hypothetical protein